VSETGKRPRIEHWYIGPQNQVFGYIYDHPRFKDGEIIKTSSVIEFDFERGKAQTKSMEFILGEPLDAALAKRRNGTTDF